MTARRSFLLPAATLVTPPQLAAPLLVLLKAGRQQWRGVIPPDVVQWLADLEELAGTPSADSVPAEGVRWMAVADAAPLLDLSVRQTTAIASKLGGRKVGRRWLLEESAVLDEMRARSAAVGRRSADVVA
jgi:hypothetical protein